MDERMTTTNHIFHRKTDLIRIRVTIAQGSQDTGKCLKKIHEKYVHVLIDIMTSPKK